MFNVQHNGIPQFSAENLQVSGETYNFTNTTPPPPPPPPAGRQTVADICYNYGLGSQYIVRAVDVTKAKNIWGRTRPTDPIVEFPFKNFFAIFLNMRKDAYIAAAFTVPATGLPNDLHGMFSHGETLPGPNLDMCLSTTPGDFNPLTSICLRSNQPPGGLLTKYKLPGYIGTSCLLTPGQTYYVNIRMHTPVPVTHPDCTGNTCRVTVVNNYSD